MENFSTLIENSKRAVRYWWLLLIIGIALFVVGILVFVYPTQVTWACRSCSGG